MEIEDQLTAPVLRLNVTEGRCVGEMTAYWVTLRLHAFVSDWKVVASSSNESGCEVASLVRQLPHSFGAHQVAAAMEGMLRELACPL